MSGTIVEVRDRHAHFFASQTTRHWEIWDGPRQRESLDWVAAELANLRASFRWATDQGDLRVATVIAAHAAIMSWPLQRFEPVGWAEEILEAVVEADLPQLPRLYIAASLCLYGGRPDVGVAYARSGRDGWSSMRRYDSFVDGWSGTPTGACAPLRWSDQSPGGDLHGSGDATGFCSRGRALRPYVGVAGRRTR